MAFISLILTPNKRIPELGHRSVAALKSNIIIIYDDQTSTSLQDKNDQE